MVERYQTKSSFKKDLNQWMREQDWLISDDPEILRGDLDRATRLACYITGNKLVFYQALRRTRKFKLPEIGNSRAYCQGAGIERPFRRAFSPGQNRYARLPDDL